MEKRAIICISREYGSGGSEVAAKLAEALGIPCFDKELVQQTAVDLGLSNELVKSIDEKPISWASMGFPHGIRNPYRTEFETLFYNLNDRVFTIQAQTIRKIAERGSCVIVGRVADDILKDDPDLVSVFVHAHQAFKVQRTTALENISEKEAADRMRKMDRERAKYYNYYAQKHWGQCTTYDLSISSSKFGIEDTVQIIREAIR
ncbi:MAG: cytidylate kinase-like family protein [Eubacteriales bacterium]|nr:cytidylate kinase-like family protein [Eubacteriales bacterium]